MIPARRVALFSNWFAMYMRYRMRKAFNNAASYAIYTKTRALNITALQSL
jgi:hypothetical protein